jgi:hypothetical protein
MAFFDKSEIFERKNKEFEEDLRKKFQRDEENLNKIKVK